MSTLVIDAAAMVDLLVGGPETRELSSMAAQASLASPAHMDAEVLSALARLQRTRRVTEETVARALGVLGLLPIDRLPISSGLLRRAWGHRHNVAMRDALYLACADVMDARVLTTDARLCRAAPERTVAPPGLAAD